MLGIPSSWMASALSSHAPMCPYFRTLRLRRLVFPSHLFESTRRDRHVRAAPTRCSLSGGMPIIISITTVGVPVMAEVTVRQASLWTRSIFDIDVLFRFGAQPIAPCAMYGLTTAVYAHLVRAGLSPHVPPTWKHIFVALVTLSSMCGFQVSPESRVMPRYLILFGVSISSPFSVSLCCFHLLRRVNIMAADFLAQNSRPVSSAPPWA